MVKKTVPTILEINFARTEMLEERFVEPNKTRHVDNFDTHAALGFIKAGQENVYLAAEEAGGWRT